jgi:hypothetical protein
MTIRSILRRSHGRAFTTLAVTTSIAALTAGFAASPSSAQVTPNVTVYCNAGGLGSPGVCEKVIAISGNTVTIQVQADIQGFTGHFEMQPPNGTVHNSKDQTWGKGVGWDISVGNFSGNYKATAWVKEGSKYVNGGSVNLPL